MTTNQPIKLTDEVHFKDGVVILQPIVMRIPNSHCVYSPSKLRPKKEVSYEEFLARYANYPRRIRVCFDDPPSSTTIFQRSKVVTAYSFGLDFWYIVVPPDQENDSPQNENV